MPKVEVRKSKGIQLDYLVARATHTGVVVPKCWLPAGGLARTAQARIYPFGPPSWAPSTDWALGGRLMERYGIGYQMVGEGKFEALTGAHFEAVTWPAEASWAEGSTPLEAGMRCLVIKKLGEVVDVPRRYA